MTGADDHDLAVNSEEAKSPDATKENNSQGVDAEERYRAIEEDYKARIDDVADLITRVRHEINNPLTGVLGQAQLLLREDLSDSARKRAETIEQMAIRIRDIVAQLRQVQKVSNS